MKTELLEKIIYRIILSVNETSREHEDMWLEAETDEDYAELNMTVTRDFDTVCSQLGEEDMPFTSIVITKLIIWDNENNDIATEADYQELVNCLKKTGWIDPAYEYEQSESERLFKLITGATQPLNVAV